MTAVKRFWEDRVTTVFPRQGSYAHDPETVGAFPPADVTIERIGDLLNLRPAAPAARAAVPASKVGGGTMNPTKALHDLGQSLWLDNITRDLAQQRHVATLHRRALGNRAHLESHDLRSRDQEQRRL